MKMTMYISYDLAILVPCIDHGKTRMCPKKHTKGREGQHLRLESVRTIYIFTCREID